MYLPTQIPIIFYESSLNWVLNQNHHVFKSTHQGHTVHLPVTHCLCDYPNDC